MTALRHRRPDRPPNPPRYPEEILAAAIRSYPVTWPAADRAAYCNELADRLADRVAANRGTAAERHQDLAGPERVLAILADGGVLHTGQL